MAQAAAQKYGIDPNVFLRQINQESGFNPNARSSAGALGIAQFMPGTARAMGVNPMDPASALDGAARLMAQNLQKYGSYQAALSAYNSGRPDAYKDPNFAGGQTYHYVRSILGGQGPVGGSQSPSQPRLGKVEGSTQGENSALLTALGELAAYEQAPVQINSGYRSYQKQAQLYANRASNSNPVAKPGTSLHERGLAADGTVNGIPLGKLPASVLSRYGLSSVPGDPVHVQLSGKPPAPGLGGSGQMLSPQPPDHRQHIVAQKVDLLGHSLAAELFSQTATLSSGGAPNLKNLFTLAKGYQGAKKSLGPPPLGGTTLAQEAGKYQAQVQAL